MAMSADSGRRVVGPGLTCLVALPSLWLYHLAVYRWYSDGWPGVVPLFSDHCVVSLRRLPCSAFSFNGSYVIFCNVCRYEDSKGSVGKLISFGGSGRILSGVNPFVGVQSAPARKPQNPRRQDFRVHPLFKTSKEFRRVSCVCVPLFSPAIYTAQTICFP